MARILFVLGGALISAGVIGVAFRFWPAAAVLFGVLLVAVATDLQSNEPA